MIINIITTEKKLTSAILKQMYQLHYELFNDVEVLGFIKSNRKSTNQEALIFSKKKNDYYLLNMLWERRGNYAGYNYSGFRGEYQKRLNPKIIDNWFEKYTSIIEEANQKGHIYI